MSKQTITERVVVIIADLLSVHADEVTLDANLRDDLDADSLAWVELQIAFEEEFNVTIPDGDVEKDTVGEVIDYLTKLKAS